MFQRLLSLPASGRETFFLWGPRQAGKSTLLRQRYPDAVWVDLLKADEFRRYVSRARAAARGTGGVGPRPGASGGHRRNPEGSRSARRGPLADREPRTAVRAVRIERAQGAARRGKPARRARSALRTARPNRRRARRRLRLGPRPQLRLPAQHVRVQPAQTPARRLHRRLSARGGRRRGSSAKPAGLLGFPGRRRAERRRAGQLLERRPRTAVCRDPPPRRTSASSKTHCWRDGCRDGGDGPSAASQGHPSSTSRTWAS